MLTSIKRSNFSGRLLWNQVLHLQDQEWDFLPAKTELEELVGFVVTKHREYHCEHSAKKFDLSKFRLGIHVSDV